MVHKIISVLQIEAELPKIVIMIYLENSIEPRNCCSFIKWRARETESSLLSVADNKSKFEIDSLKRHIIFIMVMMAIPLMNIIRGKNRSSSNY